MENSLLPSHSKPVITHRTLAVVVALFPLLLMIGVGLIPIVADYGDHALAEQALQQSTRWFWGHLLSGIAFGYSILMACCLVLFLLNEGVNWSITAVPLMTLGSTLLIFGMGADGVGPLAIQAAGQPARFFFDGSGLWVISSFMAGSIIYSLGQIILIVGVRHTSLLPTSLGIVTLIAAILFSVSSAIPAGWGLYAVGIAGLFIYLPMSWAFWRLAP